VVQCWRACSGALLVGGYLFRGQSVSIHLATAQSHLSCEADLGNLTMSQSDVPLLFNRHCRGMLALLKEFHGFEWSDREHCKHSLESLLSYAEMEKKKNHQSNARAPGDRCLYYSHNYRWPSPFWTRGHLHGLELSETSALRGFAGLQRRLGSDNDEPFHNPYEHAT